MSLKLEKKLVKEDFVPPLAVKKEIETKLMNVYGVWMILFLKD